MDKQEQLLQALADQSLIDTSQIEEFKKNSAQAKQEVGVFLVNSHLIDEETLTKVRAQLANLPYFDLQEMVINEDVLNFLPEEIARTYKVVCFARENKVIKIGLTDVNLKAMEAVNFLAAAERLRPEYYIISETGWEKAIKQYQKIEEEISGALEARAKEDEDVDILQAKQDQDDNLSSEDINSAPVSRIVSVIIRHAVEARASDIHIEPLDKESRVRYRIDGILHTSLSLPKSIHQAIIARIKVLAKLKLDETRIPQDGRIRLVIDGREIDFRVSTLPLANQEKVVMRILDNNRGVPTLENLGFNNNALVQLKEGIKKTSGMVLITGPTGSGKTTTLYAILTILNQEDVNISTLEDPIEYEMKGVNQSQIRPQVGFSFANGLRSLLRQDPNIIMVGEIRDEETAELSVNAALTGHLVLSTLHTNDALSTIFRLVDMKVERFLLSSTLRTIAAQRLVRRLCEYCRQPVQLTDEAMQELRDELIKIPEKILKEEIENFVSVDDFIANKIKPYKAVGCSHCENTGYSGRLVIAEVIDVNEILRDMINDNKNNLDIEAVKKSQDFISIRQDGFLKVAKGITTIEEVLRVIES
jgi:type IV pilus assembly protein PilB